MKRLILIALAAGCGSDPSKTETPVPVSECNGLLTVEHDTSAVHVDTGTDIEWTNNPPTSGPHYPTWAAWDRQYPTLTRGYYVHNLEHGGIVLLYRCDPECPDVVASLVEVARNMATDSACTGAVTKRVIVTSDPLLPDDVQVAAVAWNHAYTASCYDPYVETFAREHYNNAPEDLCIDGVNFGGTLLEP